MHPIVAKLAGTDRRSIGRSNERLYDYLGDDSRIVRTFAMQALADFAQDDERLRRRVLPLLDELTLTGSPAMRSRGRRLVATLRAADADGGGDPRP